MRVYGVCPKCCRKQVVEEREIHLGISCGKCGAYIDFDRDQDGKPVTPLRRPGLILSLGAAGVLGLLSVVGWWVLKDRHHPRVVRENLPAVSKPSLVGSWSQSDLRGNVDESLLFNFDADGTVFMSTVGWRLDLKDPIGSSRQRTYSYTFDDSKTPHQLELSKDHFADHPVFGMLLSTNERSKTLLLRATAEFRGPDVLAITFKDGELFGRSVVAEGATITLRRINLDRLK